jgi:hypothetical protein
MIGTKERDACVFEMRQLSKFHTNLHSPRNGQAFKSFGLARSARHLLARTFGKAQSKTALAFCIPLPCRKGVLLLSCTSGTLNSLEENLLLQQMKKAHACVFALRYFFCFVCDVCMSVNGMMMAQSILTT